MEESIHVRFSDELTYDRRLSNLEDDLVDMQRGLFDVSKVNKVKQSDEDLI